MAKSIITIGFDVCSDEVRYEPFDSKISLLDFDIIIIKPNIGSFIPYYPDTYQGKPSLDDKLSFQLKERCEHWRREIKQAVESGKTVIIFLSDLQEVFIDSGQRTQSGTGRNAKVTRIVVPYSNYSLMPLDIKCTSATGSAMKLSPLGADMLAPYWSEFGAASEYKVVLPTDIKGVCLTTRHGDKPVGALMRAQGRTGVLMLLPDIDFYRDGFIKDKDGERLWTPKAKQFCAKFTSIIVALDAALRSNIDITPEPDWAKSKSYILERETELRGELLNAESEIEAAQKKKEMLLDRIRDAGKIRWLLYEKGKPLEMAIIDALRLLGFSASPYKEGHSEFDVVFECEEGRLLGEAEGKDSKAVNVDKLRQLAMNINEDLQREEVLCPAKGVLFGNGFRLTHPDKREMQFTEKCIIAAKSSSTALIKTSDLFKAAHYLSNTSDEPYKLLCRRTLLDGIGVVTLPPVPLTEDTSEAK